MEFLSQNWFNIVTIAVLVGGWLVQYGQSKQRNANLVEEIGKLGIKFDELEDTVDTDIKNFQAHAGNSDIHVNHMMMKLFDERFDYIKKEQENTRQDIQRIEQILTKQ